MILLRWSGEAKVNSQYLGAGFTYTTEEFCREPEPTDTGSSLHNSSDNPADSKYPKLLLHL